MRVPGDLTLDSVYPFVETTPCAGSSAGSLISSMFHSGVTTADLMEGTIKLCDDCRENGTRGRLRKVLDNTLREYLPEDAHIKCSGMPCLFLNSILDFANKFIWITTGLCHSISEPIGNLNSTNSKKLW